MSELTGNNLVLAVAYLQNIVETWYEFDVKLCLGPSEVENVLQQSRLGVFLIFLTVARFLKQLLLVGPHLLGVLLLLGELFQLFRLVLLATLLSLAKLFVAVLQRRDRGRH